MPGEQPDPAGDTSEGKRSVGCYLCTRRGNLGGYFYIWWGSARRISGVYNLADPQRALAAVILPCDSRLREVARWLTVISSV